MRASSRECAEKGAPAGETPAATMGSPSINAQEGAHGKVGDESPEGRFRERSAIK